MSAGERAECLDGGAEMGPQRIDICARRVPADGEAQRTRRVGAHGLEDRRGFDLLGGTRAPRMCSDAPLVEGEQDGLGFDALHRDAGDVGETSEWIRIAEHLDTVDPGGYLDDVGDQRPRLLLLAIETHRIERSGGGTESHDGDERFQTGATTAFLITALQQGFES